MAKQIGNTEQGTKGYSYVEAALTSIMEHHRLQPPPQHAFMTSQMGMHFDYMRYESISIPPAVPAGPG